MVCPRAFRKVLQSRLALLNALNQAIEVLDLFVALFERFLVFKANVVHIHCAVRIVIDQ